MRVIPLDTIVGAYEIIESARLDTAAWRKVHDRLASYQAGTVELAWLFHGFLGAVTPGEQAKNQAKLMLAYLAETYTTRYGDPVNLGEQDGCWFDTAHIREVVSEEAFPTHEERA